MLKSWYIIFFQCPYLPEIFFRSFDLLIFEEMFKDLSHPVDADIIEAYKYAWRKSGFYLIIEYFCSLSSFYLQKNMWPLTATNVIPTVSEFFRRITTLFPG
jgi:hypothetical protein